jgi:hypothetical protein
MSQSQAIIDGFLVEWEEGEYRAEVLPIGLRSKEVGATVPVLPAVGGSRSGITSLGERARGVRERLDRTIRKVPEVMVKITSSAKGIRQASNHIDYISRKGQLDIEDQDGFVLRGKSDLNELKEDWRTSGPSPMKEVGELRETLHIVFSMPADTDEVGLKRAVRALAATEFEGHQYVMAYHTPASDPDPNPPRHPHIHLSVRMQGRDGRRLNPRKADLQRWRGGFARELRAHGIEANATSRLSRLKRDRGPSRVGLAMRSKGTELHSLGKQPHDANRLQRGQQLQADRIAYYYALSRVLAASDDHSDRDLSVRLAHHLATTLTPVAAPSEVNPNRAPDI